MYDNGAMLNCSMFSFLLRVGGPYKSYMRNQKAEETISWTCRYIQLWLIISSMVDTIFSSAQSRSIEWVLYDSSENTQQPIISVLG